METILIAGGTGLIGKQLSSFWREHGHEVRLLTRKSSQPEKGLFHWDPLQNTIDPEALGNVTVLVNLSGAGVGDKRWTKRRKQELFDSRIGSTQCLRKHAGAMPQLKHYISASGAVCYGYEQDEKTYVESDPHGTDLLSVLTAEWEAAADTFGNVCPVTKVRISFVLAAEGGALPVVAKPIRMGFGAILGSGKQGIPWIHLHDLVRIFNWTMTERLSGPYHANAGNTDNATLTRTIARVLKKPLWLPKAPAFVLRLVLGELSDLVLKGVKTDNSRIRSSGFVFEHLQLGEALKDVYSTSG